jgi:hypothetical protein
MSTPTDQRAHRRMRTLIKGNIFADRRLTNVDCTIRDLSEGGARIEFSDACNLPQEFELTIPSKNASYWARTTWRDGMRFGIAFFDRETGRGLSPLDAEDAFRIQRILDEARNRIAQSIDVRSKLVQVTVNFWPDKAPAPSV